MPIVDTANTTTKKITVSNLFTAIRGIGMSQVTNSLGSDVSLNNASSYFDGPSVAQGTSGVWFVSGTVGLLPGASTPSDFYVKLWDVTTIISSGKVFLTGNASGSMALSGYISSPAGNLRISVKASDTSAKIAFNSSGNSMDSTIVAIRIG